MNINSYIDHTLLKPDASLKNIEKLCKEAIEHKFATVCVSPHYVDKACKELFGSDVKVCTVIGFPLGANSIETKMFETTQVIEKGAHEIDMVINIAALKNGNLTYVKKDIESIAKICHKNKKILKVIIETCLLTKEEIVTACELAVKSKADFVKTSTGFSSHGAKVEDVKLMKDTVKSNAQVKASGGIRDLQAAKEMIDAGATRLGTSSGVKILNGEAATGY